MHILSVALDNLLSVVIVIFITCTIKQSPFEIHQRRFIIKTIYHLILIVKYRDIKRLTIRSWLKTALDRSFEGR